MTINTKDIEAGDIVTLRDGSRIVAYEDDGGIICLMGWPVSAWNNNGYWLADRGPHRFDIIAVEKKPEDKKLEFYMAYYDDSLERPCLTLKEAKTHNPTAKGYVKITINLTDKTKHKIEEVV